MKHNKGRRDAGFCLLIGSHVNTETDYYDNKHLVSFTRQGIHWPQVGDILVSNTSPMKPQVHGRSEDINLSQETLESSGAFSAPHLISIHVMTEQT
ncbi:hypothetical protein E2C01_025808 [Portunus trituberculatus]|uniref:Uncharacterized protein n=1 Tax=Portunus trituberculatus TaxID=210409 RepID=A0A5B7EGQ7_PORTR|nr:hypothetical protein [Portunus trituberculatus]